MLHVTLDSSFCSWRNPEEDGKIFLHCPNVFVCQNYTRKSISGDFIVLDTIKDVNCQHYIEQTLLRRRCQCKLNVLSFFSPLYAAKVETLEKLNIPMKYESKKFSAIALSC